MHVATLAKFNRNRGVISWRFFKVDDDNCFALRGDGRRWSYINVDEMRKGYKHMVDMGFAPCDLLAVQ